MDRRTGRLRAPEPSSADSDFYLRLCAVSWVYQWYRAAKEKLSIEYDDCPFRCLNDSPEWKESRKTNCDECPQKRERDKFFTDTQAVFKERFGEELTRPQFEKWFTRVANIKAFEGSDADIGVKHSHLLTGYLMEKDKFDRMRRKTKASNEGRSSW